MHHDQDRGNDLDKSKRFATHPTPGTPTTASTVRQSNPGSMWRTKTQTQRQK